MPARSLLRFPIVIVSLLVAFSPAHAASAAERSTLTGDWNGMRTRLEARGVTVTIASAHEWMRNLRGGAAVGSATLHNEDLQVEVDAERLVGWPGATWFVYGLRDHGHSPSEFAGDAQVVSNIDAPDAMKVFEAWLDQGFGDRVSVRAGLYNVNSEFDSKDAAKPFLNSSHGIGKDWSQAGANGPSIFPTTSLAARLRVQGPGTTSALVLVADGVPGDPTNPKGTHLHLSREDGALLATELGWSRAGGTGGHAARLGVGAWRFTGTFDHVERTDGAGDPERLTGNAGVYAFVEGALLARGARSISGYARTGVADGRVNPFGSFHGGGLVGDGWVPGRPDDRIAAGFAIAVPSRYSARALRAQGVETFPELAFEFTWLARVTPWLTLQPDVQFVANPGAVAGGRTAAVFGVRTIVNY